MTRAAHRLDNFVDAAFAFALSLLVIGKSEIPTDLSKLNAAIANVPIFAIGFALIGMFWYGHVRWRDYRGDGGFFSGVLSFVLVFLVLVYVPLLQAMAASFATFLGGDGARFSGDLGSLFTIDGAGFMAMSATLAGMFLEAEKAVRTAGDPVWHVIRGERIIWSILLATGGVSTLLAVLPGTATFAPFAYASLPITIGLFASKYRWS